MDEMKQYPLYQYYKRYTINKAGIINDKYTNKQVKPFKYDGRKYVFIDTPEGNKAFAVDELMVYTFIGKMDLPILYIDSNLNNLELTNLTYVIDRINIISDNVIDIANERFYQIPEFGSYYLSKSGILYSLPTNKLLKRTVSSKTAHYIKFRLSEYSNNERSRTKKSKRANLYLHQLVYSMFIGEVPDGYEIDHIDGNYMNNSYDNFQLLTPIENTRKMKLGGNCRWSLEQVDQICNLISLGYSPRYISKALNINDEGAMCIMRCNLRRGIIWREIAEKYHLIKTTDDEGSTTIESYTP